MSQKLNEKEIKSVNGGASSEGTLPDYSISALVMMIETMIERSPKQYHNTVCDELNRLLGQLVHTEGMTYEEASSRLGQKYREIVGE